MNDLERLLRRYWLLLVLSALCGGVAAFVYTKLVKPNYAATASLQVQDITELEGLAGTPAGTLQTPAALAAASARTVNTLPVLSAARAALGTKLTADQLGSTVSATVDLSSNLVLVTATAHTADFAANLADEVASATASTTNTSSRNVFKLDAQQLQKHIQAIPHTPGNLSTIQAEQADLSRLSTLAIVARPVHVAQSAQVPSAPASPKPAFDTLLGAILGFLVCGGVLLARQGLDRTLGSREEIEHAVQLPILLELEQALLGTAPLVNVPEGQEVERVTAAFGMLRRGIELMGGERPSRVVAVTSGGPEEGKTTVAVSLACAFASVGRRTALVECDLRRPALGARVDLPSEPGLTDHLLDGVALDEVVHDISLPRRTTSSTNGAHPAPFVACLLAGKPVPDPDELLASSAFRAMIKDLAEKYEVVVIDTAPILPVPDTLEILPLADVRVICVRAHQSRRAEVEAMRAVLQRLPDCLTVCVSTGWTRKDRKLAAMDYGYGDYYSQPPRAAAPQA